MNILEKDIIKFLNSSFPRKSAEKWDFVGYSVKTDNSNKKTKILVCLDVNNFVTNFAIKNNISLIISFHPFKFAKTWDEIFEYDPSKPVILKTLKENKINVFSIHTNFDKNKFGTKYWFTKSLGLINSITKEHEFAYELKVEIPILKFVNLLKDKFLINNVISNVNDENYLIKSLYISPGASNIYDFIKLNNQEMILVTSDIKWNEQQLLNDLGFKFIMIPHKTEDVFVDAIYNKLKSKYKILEIEKCIINDFWKAY